MKYLIKLLFYLLLTVNCTPYAFAENSLKSIFEEQNNAVLMALIGFQRGDINNAAAEIKISLATQDLQQYANRTFSIHELANYGSSIIELHFQTYLEIQKITEAINRSANYRLDRNILKAVRKFSVLAQSISDISSEALNELKVSPSTPFHKSTSDLQIPGLNPKFEILANPQFAGELDFLSGDILLIRSKAGLGGGISSVIANLTDVEGNYSHMAMIHTDPDGKKWVIEMDAKRKLDKISLKKFLAKDLPRLAVFRLPHKKWAEGAGKAAGQFKADYDAGKIRVIYDLKGTSDNNSTEVINGETITTFYMNCTETLRHWIAIGSNQEFTNFPAAKSSFMEVGSALENFGFSAQEVPDAPRDVLLGRSPMVFSFRIPKLTRTNRFTDAIINGVLHELSKNALSFSPTKRYRLPAKLIYKLAQRLNLLPNGFSVDLIELWLRLEVRGLIYRRILNNTEQRMLGNKKFRSTLANLTWEIHRRLENLVGLELSKNDNQDKRRLKDIIQGTLQSSDHLNFLTRSGTIKTIKAFQRLEKLPEPLLSAARPRRRTCSEEITDNLK